MTDGWEILLYAAAGCVGGYLGGKLDVWRLKRVRNPLQCKLCGERIYLVDANTTQRYAYKYVCYHCETAVLCTDPIKAVNDRAMQRIFGNAILCVSGIIAVGVLDFLLHKPIATYQAHGLGILFAFLGYATSILLWEGVTIFRRRRQHGAARRLALNVRRAADEGKPRWDD